MQSDRLAEALTDIRDEVRAILGDRPTTSEEIDRARRSLIEGHPRFLETPSALVSRYGGLMVHGLPPSDESAFAERLAAIDRITLIESAAAAVRPEALTFVVVADAAHVLAPLRSLDWANVEVIED